MLPVATSSSRIAYIIALLLSLGAVHVAADEPTGPIALHPDNPHYFVWRGSPTMLITSGEHYGALLNLDFDYVKYFDALNNDGLNHTRTFSGAYREISSSFGITDNPLAPKPNRYICPWARSDQPGCYDGGNKFDLTRWDPAYFERLKDFLIAGGALYNNLDYSFTPKHPDGTFLTYKSPGGGSPALRKQLRILKQFLYGFNFVKMRPDDSVIRKASPALSARALVERGKAYAVYLHVPIPKKPKDIGAIVNRKVKAQLTLNLPAGNYEEEWINTKTGQTEHKGAFRHQGGDKKLDSPMFAADVALRVVSR